MCKLNVIVQEIDSNTLRMTLKGTLVKHTRYTVTAFLRAGNRTGQTPSQFTLFFFNVKTILR